MFLGALLPGVDGLGALRHDDVAVDRGVEGLAGFDDDVCPARRRGEGRVAVRRS